MGQAVRIYIRQRDGSLEAQNHAAEIKLRAERKLGELLAQTVNHFGGGNGSNQYEQRSHDETVARLPEGVSKTQSHRWQKIAGLDEATFERHITEAVGGGGFGSDL